MLYHENCAVFADIYILDAIVLSWKTEVTFDNRGFLPNLLCQRIAIITKYFKYNTSHFLCCLMTACKDEAAMNFNIPIPVAIQRQRRHLSTALYVLAFIFCLAIFYDPDVIIGLFLPGAPALSESTNEVVFDSSDNSLYAMLGEDFKPAEKPEAEKVVHLPFVPKRYQCDDMFEKAGHNFTYSEFYWEHSDAYKSALTLNGILSESAVDEVSWIMHEIAMMPFVESVCETGFRAGHYSFHWLTAKPEVVVYSFESQTFNFTEDMATFMTAEFPDRFYFYPGKASASIPKFRDQNNETKCDVIYVDTISKTKEDVMTDLDNFKPMQHPKQHMLIMLDYNTDQAASTKEIWNEKIKKGEIVELFSCLFNTSAHNPSALNVRNDIQVAGVYVGTFASKK